MEVADQDAARAAGVDGVLLSLSRMDGAEPGYVALDLDYSAFRYAFGGDFGPRLPVVNLPGCADYPAPTGGPAAHAGTGCPQQRHLNGGVGGRGAGPAGGAGPPGR